MIMYVRVDYAGVPIIGVARVRHSRAFALPSLNFALNIKTFFLFQLYIDYYRSSFINYLRVVGPAR